jgi:uncharacterized protein YjbI with pentapeptide repeats
LDKYEYRVKTEQMLEYAEGKQYKKAMEIADTIDWRRVKNASMLNTVSEIYEFNGEFQKSRDILFVAYDRAPGSRKIIYRLGLLALKVKDIEEASDCYEEFVKVAPKDPNQHILKYKILKAQRSPVAEQIAALEDFKKAEYVEKWAYELASLYQEAGMTSKCLEECDDLILWFSEGKYVYQAMELKMRYKPLTPLQQEKYDSRPGAPARPKVQKTQGVKPPQRTSRMMQTEELSRQKEEADPDIMDPETEEMPVSEEAGQPEEPEVHTGGEPESVKGGPEVKRSPITKVVKGATLEEALANGVAIASGLNIEEEAMAEREEELLTGVQMKIEDILQEWEEKQKVNAGAIEEQKKKDEERLGREREEAQRRREAQKLEAERKAAQAAAERKAREEEERVREEEKRKAEEEARKAAQAEELKKAVKPQAAKRDAEEQKKILESKTQRLPDDILELVEQLESRVGGSDIEDDMDDDDLEAEVFGGAENDFAGGSFGEPEDHGMDDDFVEEEYDEDDFADDDYTEDFAEEDYVQGFEEAVYDEDDFADEDEPEDDFVKEVDFTEDESEDFGGEEESSAEKALEDDFAEDDTAEDFEEEEPEEEDFEEEDFAEEDFDESESDEEEYDEAEPAEEDDTAEDFEEEDFEEEEFAEEDFDEEEFDEEDFDEEELDEEDFDEEDFEEDEGYIEDYGDDDFESDSLEDDFDEEDFDEEDFDEEDFEEEDFEEEVLEEETDDFEEEEEEDFDVEKFLAENIPGKSEAGGSLEIEEPSEAEIQKRIKKSKGGVPFDTGFVVTGRYDLSATSEIGLKAGLTEEQKKLFSYFVPVRGMSEQIVEVLDNDRRAQREGTSKTGNLLVIGRKGSGKTVLAVDIVKAIQKQRNLKQGKVAIVTGDSLNKKELANIIQKLRGGAIIIEKAGKLNSRTIKELSYLMEKKTGEMLFVLEDQRKPLERILTANQDFKRKFTSRLELPVFINDELVTFGQTYAKENGYKLDELGILALYSRIDVMQREDHAVTVAEVKEIMDEAIAHSQKANVKHLARRMFGKSTDESNRVILKEEDFKI